MKVILKVQYDNYGFKRVDFGFLLAYMLKLIKSSQKEVCTHCPDVFCDFAFIHVTEDRVALLCPRLSSKCDWIRSELSAGAAWPDLSHFMSFTSIELASMRY